jgi:nucleotide-binding universal stress UspA family protein
VTGSIICAIDDSESARGAARVARGLSSKLGLRLVFVRVVDPGSSDQEITAIAERLERLSGRTTEVDCGAGWLVAVGHPVDRLVAAAAEEKAWLIVVGSTGPDSSLLGNVSAAVSRRAPCPVVVVPPGAGGRGDNNLTKATGRFGASFGKQAPATYDTEDRTLAGGIVRFSLGGNRQDS